ncbi:Uracil phosphoribosyltransferase, synthesizes UMP from uracil [Kappamyces sp. JEL0680]|nr:Uracil phosphoribosyltransferase, synthesizes UMP from uracil [Kappamyces sp. JEL0680]
MTKVQVLPLTKSLEAAFTVIRNKDSARQDFIFSANRICGWLVDAAFEFLPFTATSVTTPTGASTAGVVPEGNICGVSIMRAGDSMVDAAPKCRIGKILIQRDEETALPKLYYSKFPPDIASRYVLLLDPMLATGGSAIKAVEVLLEKGVSEENIVFVNLISCPEGIQAFCSAYPLVQIVTGFIDQRLNEKKYIVPGLGDFGCRYFGTDN